jgi:regulator of replication initiation timing
MTELLAIVEKVGPLSAVVVVLLYQVMYLQKKLVSIIENNTRALSELQTTIREYLKR